MKRQITDSISENLTDLDLESSFHPQKLDLRQKLIILLSTIGILLLKVYFEREKIILNEKNLKYRNSLRFVQ